MTDLAEKRYDSPPAIAIAKDLAQQRWRISPSGPWVLHQIPAIEVQLNKLTSNSELQTPGWRVEIDGSAVAALDAAGALMIFRLASAGCKDGSSPELLNFSQPNKLILNLVGAGKFEVSDLRRKTKLGFVQKVGFEALAFLSVCARICGFIGKACIETAKIISSPRRFRTRELFVQLENVLVNAVPIVSLVTFLIGIVVAYLFSIQVEKYGGNIFIVDAVSMAMMRELSPIIVAIIMAGRTGSAFTAQLGVMKINEEVDALTILGLSPFQVLIVPRLVALVLAMPLLVFVGDVVGIFGAMLVADDRLAVSLPMFLDRLSSVIPARHLFVGLIKAPVFAVFVAIIGCNMGLAVENNARSVGDNTTATVVQSIVSVILLNAAFAVIFAQLRY